jgi:hypothetical protein
MTEPTPEAFAAVAGLIGLIVDAKARSKRLAELQAATDAATKAQAKLDADRETHARAVATADEREKALRDREVKVAIAERALVAGQQELAAARRAMAPHPGFNPNLVPGSMGPGGITRDEYRS